MINRRSFLLFLPLGAALAGSGVAHAQFSASGGGGGGRGTDPGGGGSGGGESASGGSAASGGSGSASGGSDGLSGGLTRQSTGSSSSGSDAGRVTPNSSSASHGLAKDTERILAAVERGDAMPLSIILAAVRKRYQGKILRIRLRGRPDNLQYRIRVLGPDNRLIDIRVNARTAQILSDTEG